MGARCKLLGHVRDSTEFEQRREERPDGTVLICREYQVCRRCGDREEMYRNEQLLAPETAEADSHAPEAVDDTSSRASESETRRVGEHGGQDAAPVEEPDATGTPTLDQSESDGGDEPETASGDESADAGASSSPGPRHRAPSDAAGEERVTDDAVIISGSTMDTEPSAEEAPPEARTDGTGDSLTAPHESGSPTLSFDAGSEDSGQIRCGSCGREWRRDDTSLREGDLCPGCREAYVEAT